MRLSSLASGRLGKNYETIHWLISVCATDIPILRGDIRYRSAYAFLATMRKEVAMATLPLRRFVCD